MESPGYKYREEAQGQSPASLHLEGRWVENEESIKMLPRWLSGKESTWVQSLGWEDLLEEGMATHSSILAWRILMDRGAWWATVHGVAKSRTRLSD